MPDLRRSTLLFSQGQAADSLYYLESGLVKFTRNNSSGGRVILSVRGMGEIAGEETLESEVSFYESEAEILSVATAYRIPKPVLTNVLEQHPDLYPQFIHFLLQGQITLAEKVELLCLHDVEFRVLHYLGTLCKVVRLTEGSDTYQIPMTQLELADLIGATRETTSTVLNQLERRGLVHLSRRMLTVSSLPAIASALDQVTEQVPLQQTVPLDGTDQA